MEITVKQRSTTAVPGSDGKLLLTIEDVTGGQVIASLATTSGEMLLAPRSMSPNAAVIFKLGESSYSLKLKQLNNEVVGDDFATFNIVEATAGLTEADKIEQLIVAIAELEGATFIRNGAEHRAREAADHLRMKWRAAGAQIKTAEQFIEAIASKSSSSGQPYQIRRPDGEIVQAGDYLRKRLREIESAK